MMTRCDLSLAELDRRGQPQHTARAAGELADGRVCVVEALQAFETALEVDATGFSHVDAARGALEQARADALLECGDVFGDRGGREPKLACGAGEARALRDAHEDTHGLNAIHGDGCSRQSIE